MKKLIVFLAILFFMSGCSATSTTTCTNKTDAFDYKAKIEAKDDKIMKMNETIIFSFDAIEVDEDTAKTFLKKWEKPYIGIEGLIFTSKIDSEKKEIVAELTMDFEKADISQLLSKEFIKEELLINSNNKQYPSLKILVETNEINGQTCK